jgi:hypothetical protein
VIGFTLDILKIVGGRLLAAWLAKQEQRQETRLRSYFSATGLVRQLANLPAISESGFADAT